MAKNRAKLWEALTIAVVGLFLLGSVPLPYLSRQELRRAFICDRCGIRLRTDFDELTGSTAPAKKQQTLEPTELSRWSVNLFGSNGQHTWQFNHSSAQTYASIADVRLWNYSGSAGSAVTHSLVHLSDDDKMELEKLLHGGPQACKDYIHTQLVREDR